MSSRLKWRAAIAMSLAAGTLGVAVPSQATSSFQTVVNVGAASASVAKVRVYVAHKVTAGQSATATVKAPKGSRCRVSLRHGKDVWHSPLARAGASTTALEFPWQQAKSRGGSHWRVGVLCTGSGDRSASTAYRVRHGKVAPSRPYFEKPIRVSRRNQNPLGLGGGRGSRPYGTLLVAGSSWLGGAGIDVYSNGEGSYSPEPPGPYGYRWQCVELVNRLVMSKGWSGRIWGNGADFFRNGPTANFDKHASGDGYMPVPGDIMVWGGGWKGFGHVAVVRDVSGGFVNFVEQNGSPSGLVALSISNSGVPARYGDLSFTGYLHAKANHASPGSAPAAPVVNPSQYDNTIVQWDGDTKTQKTAWLVSGGKRYWIPDGGVYNCLKGKGAAGPVALSSGILNQLPDQTGKSASCTSTTPQQPAGIPITTTTQFLVAPWKGGSPVNIRTGPSTSYPVAYTLPTGTVVRVICQAAGGPIGSSGMYPGNSTWDKLTDGNWIHDALTDSAGGGGRTELGGGNFAYWTAGWPRC